MQSPYVWYSKNVPNDSPDLVHNTLALGTLHDIFQLQKTIGKDLLNNIFIEKPLKIYRPSTLNFISKFILNYPHPIDASKYLKTTSRYIG